MTSKIEHGLTLPTDTDCPLPILISNLGWGRSSSSKTTIADLGAEGNFNSCGSVIYEDNASTTWLVVGTVSQENSINTL